MVLALVLGGMGPGVVRAEDASVTWSDPGDPSALGRTSYNPAKQTLRIDFSVNGTYEYRGVPPELYDALNRAESKGKFFNDNIRGKFQSQRVSQMRQWQTLAPCVLLENESNDGDSFHVWWSDHEFIFRIYYVDCPEVDNRFPDRVKAQAAYFGITPEQAMEIGRKASDFTMKFLSGSFNIKTRWRDALGSSRLKRSYGCVSVDGKDLAELLVANGLARIHGVGIAALATEEVARLKALELEAKTNKTGAWGLSSVLTDSEHPESNDPPA